MRNSVFFMGRDCNGTRTKKFLVLLDNYYKVKAMNRNRSKQFNTAFGC